MSDFLLTQLINYGAPLFGLTLFLGALGVPIPASVLLIAAGAFSQQGFLDGFSLAGLGLLGAVAGDVASFGMGHFAKDWVDKKFGGSTVWKNARDGFESRAGMAVYFTRFLITALAIPTNLIAGGSGYKFRNFLLYDIAGESTWILLYGGLGYLFGSEWELVSDFISNFGGLLLGVVVLGVGIWLGVKQMRKTTVAVVSE